MRVFLLGLFVHNRSQNRDLIVLDVDLMLEEIAVFEITIMLGLHETVAVPSEDHAPSVVLLRLEVELMSVRRALFPHRI